MEDFETHQSEGDNKEAKITESLLIRVHGSQSSLNPDLKSGLTEIAANQQERFLRALRIFLSDKKKD